MGAQRKGILLCFEEADRGDSHSPRRMSLKRPSTLAVEADLGVCVNVIPAGRAVGRSRLGNLVRWILRAMTMFHLVIYIYIYMCVSGVMSVSL